jgi:hypothetical protein
MFWVTVTTGELGIILKEGAMHGFRVMHLLCDICMTDGTTICHRY